MDIGKTIKLLLVEENIKPTALADMINTTKQNLSRKFTTNNFLLKDLEKIADVLGYDLKIEFIKKGDNNQS